MDIWIGIVIVIGVVIGIVIGIVIGVLAAVVAGSCHEINTLEDRTTSQPEKEDDESTHDKDNIADVMLIMEDRMRWMAYRLDSIKQSVIDHNEAELESLKNIEEGVAGYGQEILGRMNSIGESLDDFFDEDEDDEEEEDDEDEESEKWNPKDSYPWGVSDGHDDDGDGDDDDTLIMEEQMRMIARDLAEKWWGKGEK